MDVNENIAPMWLTDLVGTWKQYVFVLCFLLMYAGCSYIAYADDLINMSEINVDDYFDRNDSYTKIMFTDKEITNQYNKNKEYVEKIIYSKKGQAFDNTTFSSKFDEVISSFKFTNFNAVVRKPGDVYDE